MITSRSLQLTSWFPVAALALGIAACGSDPEPGNSNNTNNNKAVPGTVVRSGSLTNVDGTPSATGSISVRTDDAGKTYLYLSADFVQEMGPGDTELRLAKAGTSIADQMAADASSVSAAIGIIPNASTGTFLFEIPSSIDAASFSHAIVWCPTAGVNFGVSNFGNGSTRTFGATLANVDGTPSATGSVTLTETSAGTFMISLGADFVQEMGPGDTEIRLAKAASNIADQMAGDPASVSDALGVVPNAHTGARTFEITGIEPGDYGHLIIWCPTAGVNFGAGSISASN
jgi:hypothetical protein